MNFSKPQRATRIEQELKNRQIAAQHREKQRLIAILRDDGCCAVCFFIDNKRKSASDVHHVYGRAVTKKITTSWREHYTSLLCLCREHHNEIGAIRKPGSNWYDIVNTLAKANTTPINKEFKHVSQK